MPRIFIPQIPMRWDEALQRHRQFFSFASIENLGEKVVLFDPDTQPHAVALMAKQIRSKMIDFTDEDYLVCIGDPTLIAACAIAASRVSPVVRLLKWDKQTSSYLKLEYKP